jgi:hypothetical protein
VSSQTIRGDFLFSDSHLARTRIMAVQFPDTVSLEIRDLSIFAEAGAQEPNALSETCSIAMENRLCANPRKSIPWR